MENQIKEGDVVQLKSGGPKMTVVRVVGAVAICIYFDIDTSKLHVNAEFPLVALSLPESRR